MSSSRPTNAGCVAATAITLRAHSLASNQIPALISDQSPSSGQRSTRRPVIVTAFTPPLASVGIEIDPTA